MKPPGNANAALAKGRREKLTDWRAYHACSHSATITGRTPQGHAHYAAEYCAACGAFIRWLPKPQSVERRRLNGLKLAKLGMCSGLNAWERGFVRDVAQRRKVSPRQQSLVERLVRQYLAPKRGIARWWTSSMRFAPARGNAN